MASFRGKILVIRGGAIGDFILTVPAISALRQQFPEAHLEVLGYPHIVQLAVAGGLVDRVQSIEARALAGFFARGGELAADLVDYFSEFDLIVSYLYDPDQIFRANVGRCTAAQFIAAPHRPDERANVPASQVFLKPLERLAIFNADPIPKLRIKARPMGTAPASLEGETDRPSSAPPMRAQLPTLALHPGSGSEMKNWPEAKWSVLLQRLIDSTAINLLMVGGEAEGERLQRLSAALPPARTKVAQSLPLHRLADLLQDCAAFIGHDSGISHLAAALELPVVILWGDTPEEVWRPLNPRTIVLKKPGGLRKLEVEDALTALHSVSDLSLSG